MIRRYYYKMIVVAEDRVQQALDLEGNAGWQLVQSIPGWTRTESTATFENVRQWHLIFQKHDD